MSLYEQFISAGALCFDIGAYVGEKTQEMLDLGASKVVSIEPQPGSFDHLRERFENDPRVELVNKGIAAYPGTMTMFYDEPKIRKSGSLTVATFSKRYTEEGRFAKFGYADRLRAEMTTLDGLVELYGVPNFCKIDVEGFERQVITGLSQPLPALCYEYAIEFEDEALACAKLLQALGEYEFNFAEGQNQEFSFPQWTPDEEEFVEKVREVPCTDWAGLLWGDVYARRRDE
jgi:FkbM family methyltransferase